MNTKKQTVAVIGGGVIGLTSAYQLQKLGYAVTIFDGNGLASTASASFGNAGHFATEQVFPLADAALIPQLPKMLVDPLGPFKIQPSYFAKALPWFMRFMGQMRQKERLANGNAIKALNTQSIPSWQRLARDINAENLVLVDGSLLTYESDGKAIEAELQHYRAQGVAVEKVSAQRLKQLAPSLSNKIVCALHFTEVGHTPCPQQLCQRIGDAFKALGGLVVRTHVDNISQSTPPRISAGNEVQAFDKVVVCTGAHGKKLVKQLGFDVPLETERGYHLMLPIKSSLTRPVASADRKFIMTPMANGLRLAGTVEFGGLENAPDYRRSEMLLTHAKAMLDQAQVPELGELELSSIGNEARWMGFRPSLPDSLPIIDKSPNNPSILFNFGHQHLGLTWGAISGELMASLITGQQPRIELAPYRITRF